MHVCVTFVYKFLCVYSYMCLHLESCLNTWQLRYVADVTLESYFLYFIVVFVFLLSGNTAAFDDFMPVNILLDYFYSCALRIKRVNNL